MFHHQQQEAGRDLARDIKRKALTRKKTRIEEKLAKAKDKVWENSMTQVAVHVVRMSPRHFRLFEAPGEAFC